MSSSTKQKFKGIAKVLYNNEDGTILGRTCISWTKITIFYVLFYCFLFAFWTFTMIVFFGTLHPSRPTYILTDSRIGDVPGLGHRPHSSSPDVDTTVIYLSQNFSNEYALKKLTEFLDEYNRTGSESCSSTGETACQFTTNTTWGCNDTDNYGFDTGQPCVAVKINRIYGWKPVGYGDRLPDNLPESINASYSDEYVYVSCEGERAADVDNIGDLEYYPGQGISTRYFPFVGQENYLSPFVFVKFLNPEPGVLVHVLCKVWAGNIRHDVENGLGVARFAILVDF